jgi:hypothetical protein
MRRQAVPHASRSLQSQIRFDFAGRIHGPHQGFADEHGIGSGVQHAARVVEAADAAFGDEQDLVGGLFGELFGSGEVDLEGFQIAVVDTDEVGPEFEGAFHFRQVVNLDEHIDLGGARFVVEAAELVVIESGDDEQDGVRAGDDRFVDLQGMDGEVLAQQWGLGDAGDGGEVGERALEVALVGQHREAACAAIEVALGLAERVEIGIDDADGGRGLFDLGDDPEAAGSAVEGGAEAAEVVALEGGGAEMLRAGQQGLDFEMLGGDDLGEFVGHGACRNQHGPGIDPNQKNFAWGCFFACRWSVAV